MARSSTPEMLFFLHIQKTAGTSVKGFLQAQFDRTQVCPYLAWADISRIPPKDFQKYRLFYGQHPAWLTEVMPPEARFATLLRHPVQRTLSHFNYLKSELGPKKDKISEKNGPEYYFCKQVFENNKTFEEMIEDPIYVAYYVVNFQTRYLSTQPSDFQKKYDEQSSFSEIQRVRDTGLLEIAKARLEKMDFVGTVDQLQLFLLYLCHKLEWFSPIDTPHYNSSMETAVQLSDVSPVTIRIIEKITNLDLELYHFAAQLLQKRTESLSLSQEINNKNYFQSLANTPKKESIVIDFDSPFFGNGWHPRELDITGKSFRWTGPRNTSYVDFCVHTDKNLFLSFRINASLEPSQLDQFQVFANNDLLEVKNMHREMDNQSGSFFAIISKETLQKNPNFCHVEFRISEVKRPIDIDPSNCDNRFLGLSFGWIHLGPTLF